MQAMHNGSVDSSLDSDDNFQNNSSYTNALHAHSDSN